jgi:hypothetical protein
LPCDTPLRQQAGEPVTEAKRKRSPPTASPDTRNIFSKSELIFSHTKNLQKSA